MIHSVLTNMDVLRKILRNEFSIRTTSRIENDNDKIILKSIIIAFDKCNEIELEIPSVLSRKGCAPSLAIEIVLFKDKSISNIILKDSLFLDHIKDYMEEDIVKELKKSSKIKELINKVLERNGLL